MDKNINQYAAIAAGGAVVVAVGEGIYFQLKITELEAKIAELEKKLSGVEDLQSKQTKIDRKIKVIESDLDSLSRTQKPKKRRHKKEEKKVVAEENLFA